MREGMPVTPEALLAEMDHYGIHEALVLDALAVEVNPRAGNQRLLEFTRPHPRLHPAWVGLLPTSHELLPPEELVARMREAGAKLLCACISSTSSKPTPVGLGVELCWAVEEASVPSPLPKSRLGRLAKMTRRRGATWCACAGAFPIAGRCHRKPRLGAARRLFRHDLSRICNLDLHVATQSLELLVQDSALSGSLELSTSRRCPGSHSCN